MEGYLIRLPSQLNVNKFWRYASLDVDDIMKFTGESKKDFSKPQLLYYVLEEGYLQAYTSHQTAHRRDKEYLVENIVLTAHDIEVERMEDWNLLYYVLEEGYLQAYTSHQTAHRRDKEYLVENIVLTAHDIEVERMEDWNVIYLRTLATTSGLDTKTNKTETKPAVIDDEEMVRCSGRLQRNTQCSVEDDASDVDENDHGSDPMYCFCFHLPFSRKSLNSYRVSIPTSQPDDSKQLWLYAAQQDLMNKRPNITLAASITGGGHGKVGSWQAQPVFYPVVNTLQQRFAM
ncbi:hypothetical protein ABG067_000181 [Albugo candida]